MKVLIDTDPGIDDAIALSMVLARNDIQILGITTVVGNTNLDNTTINVLKVLDVFCRKDIPVFRGASSPMLNRGHNAEHFHGTDGLGDAIHTVPDKSPLQEEVAALAINRICRQHSGEVTVIALGPLTNLALALRLNSELSSHIKDLIIMGGNYKGVGNVTMAAEFNFFFDPISAHIVLEEFSCRKYLVTWELSGAVVLTENDVLSYCGHDNPRSEFMRKIIKPKESGTTLCGYCDSVAVAIAINRDIITKHHAVYATVEVDGQFTKGAVVIDWNPQYRTVGGKKDVNVVIPEAIDVKIYREMFMKGTE